MRQQNYIFSETLKHKKAKTVRSQNYGVFFTKPNNEKEIGRALKIVNFIDFIDVTLAQKEIVFYLKFLKQYNVRHTHMIKTEGFEFEILFSSFMYGIKLNNLQ